MVSGDLARSEIVSPGCPLVGRTLGHSRGTLVADGIFAELQGKRGLWNYPHLN